VQLAPGAGGGGLVTTANAGGGAGGRAEGMCSEPYRAPARRLTKRRMILNMSNRLHSVDIPNVFDIGTPASL
jgi:hypothetical protein